MRTRIKVIIPVLMALVALLLMSVIRTYISQKEALVRVQSLPDAVFPSLYGGAVRLTSFDHQKPVVIKYFHPECAYCRFEAREMAARASDFSDTQILMITPDDSIKRVERFIAEHNLLEIDNIEFLTDRDNHFRSIFGKAVLPSVYIYGPDQKLAGHFQGETMPEAILEVIHAILKTKENTP